MPVKIKGDVLRRCSRGSIIVGGILLILTLAQPSMAADITLTMEESIALAFKSNADIKIAETNRENANWALKQAQSNKGVTVDFSHTDTHYSSPVVIDDQTANNSFSNKLSLTIPVYSGGKLESQIEQAELAINVAEQELNAAKQLLRQNVITYYYNVLEYRNEVKVYQETVDNYEAHLKLVQSQYRTGTVAKAEVLSSQVELANAQDTLSQAKKNYDVAVAKLNNVIGLPLASQLILTQEFTYEKYPSSLEACEQYAVINRPELAKYQAKIKSAEADIKIAQSGYRPSVDFSLLQSWSDKDFPGANNGDWQASVTASMNLFDSGLNKSKVKQSEYSLDNVKEQARQQRDTVLLEVREAYLAMSEAEKRLDTKKVAIEQAEESLMIAEARYRLGAGTNLAVFDAVVALNTAKLNSNKALYDYNTSKVQLEKAMGIAVTEK